MVFISFIKCTSKLHAVYEEHLQAKVS